MKTMQKNLSLVLMAAVVATSVPSSASAQIFGSEDPTGASVTYTMAAYLLVMALAGSVETANKISDDQKQVIQQARTDAQDYLAGEEMTDFLSQTIMAMRKMSPEIRGKSDLAIVKEILRAARSPNAQE
jgi:hypothetical protein